MIEFAFALLVGGITGVLTGAGIGGGTILVLYLTILQGVAQGAAQGVNLLYFLCSAPPALFFHIKEKRIDIKSGLCAALSGCIFAALSGYLSGTLDEHTLRTAFGFLCILIGVKELFSKKDPP